MAIQIEYIVSDTGPPVAPTPEQLGDEAKRLLEAGDKSGALSQSLIATDLAPGNEAAWLLRAQATDNPQEAVESLERVLSSNPENAQAREDLIYVRMHGLQLGVRGATNTGAAAEPETGVGTSIGRLLQSPLVRIGLGVAVLALCGLSCLTLFFVGNNFISPNPQSVPEDASLTQQVFILPPIWTPTPTRPPTRTPSPTPTPSGKTKISLTVRAGPGTNFPRLGTLPQNSIMTIIGRSSDGKFIVIVYPESDKPGWVAVDSVDLGGTDLNGLTITVPPPTAPAPTRPPVAVVLPIQPSSTPSSPLKYVVNSRGCQHSGGTFIEGVVTNPYGEEANARVTLGSSPGANGIQTIITGSERSPGYYTFVLNANGANPGTYYIWIADVSGKILSDPNAARVTIDSSSCWQAFFDFVRR